jgi:hypothetical protein
MILVLEQDQPFAQAIQAMVRKLQAQAETGGVSNETAAGGAERMRRHRL